MTLLRLCRMRKAKPQITHKARTSVWMRYAHKLYFLCYGVTVKMGFSGSTQSTCIASRFFIRSFVLSFFIFLCLITTSQIRNPFPALSDVVQKPSEAYNAFHAAILSPKIDPHKVALPPFGSALKLELPAKSAERWALVHKVFTDHNPGQLPHTESGVVYLSGSYQEMGQRCERPSMLTLGHEQISKAQTNHGAFLKQLPELASAFTFFKDRRGIVTTAGGWSMPMLVVSLKMLRKSGCTLPVEVFVASLDEYEPNLCERVFPSLDAKCVLLADGLLNDAMPYGKQTPKTYQIKPFAILFSSFNQILFLDADNFPATNPEPLFESKHFKQTGLIIWPDFWCPTQSPHFYEIAGIPETPAGRRPSSESGQIMYDKTRHIEDLLLACYYNYWGPNLWWPLLSQGYAGQGDKETYLAAAEVRNAPFYQVEQAPLEFAMKEASDVSILQADPRGDDAAVEFGEDWREARSPVAFFHAHHPKLNALNLMNDGYSWAQNQHGRMWAPVEESVRLFGHDLEYEVWKAIKYTACDLSTMFKTWENQPSSCQWVQEHMRLVFGFDE